MMLIEIVCPSSYMCSIFCDNKPVITKFEDSLQDDWTKYVVVDKTLLMSKYS